MFDLVRSGARRWLSRRKDEGAGVDLTGSVTGSRMQKAEAVTRKKKLADGNSAGLFVVAPK